MDNDTLTDLHNSWAIAIGSAILGFGDIEWVSYEYIVRFSSKEKSREVSKLPFAQRVELIKKTMKKKNNVSNIINSLFNKLDEAKNLSKIRNAIVHNPLQVSIYADNEGNIQLKDQVLSYSDNNKMYVLNDVVIFAESSWSLARELRKLYSQLDEELPP